jgi:hypothetical protein
MKKQLLVMNEKFEVSSTDFLMKKAKTQKDIVAGRTRSLLRK